MLFGVLPQSIYAEETETETEEIIEETVPEETQEELTEEQEEVPAEEEEITEEISEEDPEVIEEEPAEEIIQITEDPAEDVPETEEPVQTEVPEIEPEPVIEEAEVTAAGEIIPETEAAAEPEEVTEEEVPAETAVQEPAEEIIEEITEENELPEAPVTYVLTLNANGGKLDTELTGLSAAAASYGESLEEYEEYYVYGIEYYAQYVTRSGYKFAGWYRNKSCTDGYEAEEYTYITMVSDLTLYAKWLPAWKVTFKANGGRFDNGDSSASVMILKKELVQYCPEGDPVRDGMSFDGWSLVKNDRKTVIDLEFYTPSSDTVLYAYWNESVKVTFKANGGTFYDGSSVFKVNLTRNQTYDLSYSYVPERSGYMFAGWYANSSLDDKYKVGNAYLLTKDTTLYAKWAKHYTVKFDANGKNALSAYVNGTYYENKSSITIKTAKGTRVTDNADIPYVSDISGYQFMGWYKDAACTDGKEVDPYTFIPTGNTVLYAKWAKLNKVTFKGTGGFTEEGTSTYTVYVPQGSCIGEAPQFMHSSKAFGGWYLDSALTKKVTYVYGYVPSGNMTLYAKWVSGVMISFDANGGEFESGETVLGISARKGSDLRMNVPVPDRDGYVFMGWYKDKSYTDYVYDPYYYEVSSSAVLYAKWAKACKITFDAGEGWFGEYNEETDQYEMKHKTSSVYGKGTYMYESVYYPDHNISGARGDWMDEYLPSPVRTERYMVFDDWYTDKALTKRFNIETTKITGPMTLYAKYKEIKESDYVTLTIDPNGGTFSMTGCRKISVEKNSYFYTDRGIMNPPAGKQFFGFTTVKDDPSTLLAEGALITKNMTVYAYYLPVYTVILNANGGFIANGGYGYGYVSECDPLRSYTVFENHGIDDLGTLTGDDTDSLMTNEDGKIFRGWYSDKACTKFVTYDVRTYRFKKNMTLYAKWGAPVKEGWKKSNGRWWYRLKTGGYYAGEFAEIADAWYYFDDVGYMVTGWQKIDGKWYWFSGSGAMAEGWKKLNNKWYYFDYDGIMVTGWQKISGKWYYFTSGGSMVTGWKKISGKWYYFLSGGAMVTGWKKIGGVWYYFLSGGQMTTGWKKISGKWYYFESSGAMVTGSRTIGSKTYQFDSDGVCLNP